MFGKTLTLKTYNIKDKFRQRTAQESSTGFDHESHHPMSETAKGNSRWKIPALNPLASVSCLWTIPFPHAQQHSVLQPLINSAFCTCSSETPGHPHSQVYSGVFRLHLPLLPLNGLNLFSRSNSCLPRRDRSIRRSGHMAYSSIVLLIW